MRAGVVIALPGELACLGHGPAGSEPVQLAPGVLALVSGIGPARATAAARTLVGQGACGLVSFGVAGGLDPRLAAGALVLGSEVVDLAGVRYATDTAWNARIRGAAPQVVAGGVAESEVVLDSRAAKAERARATGAIAVDMESGAVARVASTSGLPFVVLRAICDPATTAVPRASLVAVDGAGKLRPGALAAALLRRPGDLVGLIAMHSGWRKAQQALRTLATRLGADLAAPEDPGG